MNPIDINTLDDAQTFCEGLINDFEGRVSTKAETLEQLGFYTARIMHIFEGRTCEFSEWSAKNGYVFKPDGKWSKGGLSRGVSLCMPVNLKYTTKELYDLFLTSVPK